jgi:hypothetical protein
MGLITASAAEMLTREDDAESHAIRAAAQAERDRLAEFEEQAISGALSAASFARIGAKIEARIAELEQKAREASTPKPLRDLIDGVSGSTPDERYAEIMERWQGMELAAKRSVIRAIFAPALYPPPVEKRFARFHAMDRSRFRMPLDQALAA